MVLYVQLFYSYLQSRRLILTLCVEWIDIITCILKIGITVLVISHLPHRKFSDLFSSGFWDVAGIWTK